MIVVLLLACVSEDTSEDTAVVLTPQQQDFLIAHNAVRTPLKLRELQWDNTVADSAREWARELAENQCAFEHENQQTYGENLWWSSFEPTPYEVVDAWASEVAFYDYETNTCEDGQMCGHYTQLVWADTERVGCGMATCVDGSIIWNCRYDPPGNWLGERPY